VRSKQKHVGLWDHLFGKDPKEEVTIKAPRQIALSIRGVNGACRAATSKGLWRSGESTAASNLVW
jgi:hypothetical protein